MAHVQVVTVAPTRLRRVLRLPGTVAYNFFETTPVITQISGPISRILIVPGENVRAGQPMLYVASPDFAQLRTNYLKAKDAYALAQKSYARSQDLYQHRVIAQADLEQAESTQNQAQADLQAAEQALNSRGNRASRSPVEGHHDAGSPGACPHRRRGRGKAGFARAGDPGGRHAGLYDFQHGRACGFWSMSTSATWAPCTWVTR